MEVEDLDCVLFCEVTLIQTIISRLLHYRRVLKLDKFGC